MPEAGAMPVKCAALVAVALIELLPSKPCQDLGIIYMTPSHVDAVVSPPRVCDGASRPWRSSASADTPTPCPQPHPVPLAFSALSFSAPLGVLESLRDSFLQVRNRPVQERPCPPTRCGIGAGIDHPAPSPSGNQPLRLQAYLLFGLHAVSPAYVSRRPTVIAMRLSSRASVCRRTFASFSRNVNSWT